MPKWRGVYCLLLTRYIPRQLDSYKSYWINIGHPIQVVIAQKERDDSIAHLVSVMNAAYEFVQEAVPLKQIESQAKIINCLIQQTIECAYFIRDYTKNKDFCEFQTWHGFVCLH